MLLEGYAFTIINSRHIHTSVNECIDECRIMSSTGRSLASSANLSIELLHQSLRALMIYTIRDVFVFIRSFHNLLFLMFFAAKVVSNYAGFFHRCDKDNSKHEYSWKSRLSGMPEKLLPCRDQRNE